MSEPLEETHTTFTDEEAQLWATFPGPAAAAAAIVSYYPELVDVDLATKNTVKDYIGNAPGLRQLIDAISRQGRDGWAPPQPIILENGQPAKNQQGEDINQLMLSEQTTSGMIAPVAETLGSVRSDTSLENILWTIQQGIPPGDRSALGHEAGGADDAALAAGTRWTLREVAPRFGVTVPSISFDYSDNTFRLQLTNEYARHLAVYVEFLAADKVITPAQWTSRLPAQLPAKFETDKLKYLGVLGPTNHVAGMKVKAEPVSITFPLPAEATSARLLFGGLGTQTSGSIVEAVGTILTVIMDQALPAIVFTAQQTQPDLNLSDWFNSVLGNDELRNEVISAGSFLITGKSTAPWPELVIKVPVLLLGASLPKLAANIKQNVGVSAIDDAAPYLGWAAQGLETLSSPNVLTMSELLSTLATFALDLSPIMAANLSVTVKPDPVRAEWPDAADHYRVTATFSGGRRRQATGAMPTSSTTPLVLSFPDVPMDEGVDISVAVYAKNDWLCGSGQTTATISKATGSANFDISLNISENRIALGAGTEYSHKRKLVYDTATQQHVWKTGPAPTTVWSGSTDCASSGNVLCRLVGMTLNEKALMLGYSWQASGQGLSPCGQSSSDSGQLFAFQNIAVPQPQSALKFPSCGFLMQASLVYQRSAPGDEPARASVYNFYLDSQTTAIGASCKVRGVTLDTQTPFDLSQTRSWGTFVEAGLTSFVVHPKGYVISVNYGSSKMEILQLPTEPVADADAPVARLTSGPGTLAGLLKGPIAVDVTGDLVILVLEQENARIQAFDIYGNPVPYFPNGSPFAPLREETPAPTYLDMSVTDDGWIYVLSYVETGSKPADYRLDIYTPAGVFLSRTVGVNGAKLVVDSWRRVYTLNYESFLGPGGRTEPSVSQWTPL